MSAFVVPRSAGKATDLTQGSRWRRPGSVQDIPGQLPPQVEQKRGAHVVQEEGILWATGCMAQDEPADEPGGGGPKGAVVRSLETSAPLPALHHPLGLPPSSPPDRLCSPLSLGCLPPAQRSPPPGLDADGCGDHRMADPDLLTSVAHPSPRPCPSCRPLGPPEPDRFTLRNFCRQ